MFAVVAMTFGQKNSVDGVNFYLNNGTTNTDLTVAHNKSSNLFVLTFDYPVNITSVNYAGVIEVSTLVEKTIGVEGAYSLVINYDDTFGGYVTGNVIVNFIPFDLPQYTTQDTVDSYTNGYNIGVASVVCDFTEQDTIKAYNNGFTNGETSVNTECDTTTSYNSGYLLGVLSVDGADFEAGFNAGQSTCSTTSVGEVDWNTDLKVYPNPVVDGTFTINYSGNFDHADIINLSGQTVGEPINSNNVSVPDLTTGVYFLNVWDTNGNVNTVKIIKL